MDVGSLYKQILDVESENVEKFYNIVPASEDTDELENISYDYLNDEELENPIDKKLMDKNMDSSYSENTVAKEETIETPSKNKFKKSLDFTENTSTPKRIKTDDSFSSKNSDFDFGIDNYRNAFSDGSISEYQNSSIQNESSSNIQNSRFSIYSSRIKPKFGISSTINRKHKFLRRYKTYRNKNYEVLKHIDNTQAIPIYKDHQLMGDSQFLRFCEQILMMQANFSYTEDTNSRRLGYCVSGQKIKDLERRLQNNEYRIHEKVMLFIGTNDLLHYTPLEDMCEAYDSIIKLLSKHAKKIVLLTVPPIPKLVSDKDHFTLLIPFNKFIKSKQDGRKIFTVDLGNHYVAPNNRTLREYYEQHFFDGRIDLLHLNRNGFLLMEAILNINYFNMTTH